MTKQQHADLTADWHDSFCGIPGILQGTSELIANPAPVPASTSTTVPSVQSSISVSPPRQPISVADDSMETSPPVGHVASHSLTPQEIEYIQEDCTEDLIRKRSRGMRLWSRNPAQRKLDDAAVQARMSTEYPLLFKKEVPVFLKNVAGEIAGKVASTNSVPTSTTVQDAIMAPASPPAPQDDIEESIQSLIDEILANHKQHIRDQCKDGVTSLTRSTASSLYPSAHTRTGEPPEGSPERVHSSWYNPREVTITQTRIDYSTTKSSNKTGNYY